MDFSSLTLLMYSRRSMAKPSYLSLPEHSGHLSMTYGGSSMVTTIKLGIPDNKKHY